MSFRFEEEFKCVSCWKTFNNKDPFFCKDCNGVFYCSQSCKKGNQPYHKERCDKTMIPINQKISDSSRTAIDGVTIISVIF